MKWLVLALIHAAIQSIACEPSWMSRNPWSCDADCLAGIVSPVSPADADSCVDWSAWPAVLSRNLSSANSSTGKCHQLDPESPSKLCPRQVKDVTYLAPCEVASVDVRIPCIPAGATYQWYRGQQAETVDGITCRRWDEVPALFGSFFEVNSGDAGHSRGVHSHENHCRNPDGWQWGPWCFLEGTALERQPCFRQCHESVVKTSTPCLSRVYLSLLQFIDTDEGHHSRFGADDIPLNANAQYSSLYTIPAPDDPSSLLMNKYSSYTVGDRAKVFGPWMFVAQDKGAEGETAIPWSRAASDETDYSNDKWTRVYEACEDFAVTCSPSKTFRYHGPRDKSVKDVDCSAPSHVFEELLRLSLEYKTDYIFKLRNPKLWQFWQLFSQPMIDDKENQFFAVSAHRFTNKECFNYGQLVKDISFDSYRNLKVFDAVWIGCFVVELEKQKLITIDYVACFEKCPESSPEPQFLSNNRPKVGLDVYSPVFHDHQNLSKYIHFDQYLDRGSALPSILLLATSCFTIIVSVLVCVLHALGKV